jgi:hypothetical protein
MYMLYIEISEYVEHCTESNLGEAFVRYRHKRDLNKALAGSKDMVIEGSTVKIEAILPHYWPTQKTRTFF